MSGTELEENWKEKYFKALLETEELEKAGKERLEELYRELLHAFGHFRGREESIDEALGRLPDCDHVDQVSLTELQALNRQIAEIIDDLSSSKSATDSGQETDPLGVAKDSLEYLVQNLPKEVARRLDSEKTDFSQDRINDINTLREAADEIKNTITCVLNERNKKIKELSSFLGGVARKLDGLQTHMQDEKSNRQSSSKDRGELEKVVGDNLKEIKTTVAEAEDIEQLQKAIESRLEEIDKKVASFVEAETERADQAEKASAVLESQLEKLRNEADQLRQSLEAARTDAIVDPLTGVSNRRAYDERFQVEYSRWKRYHEPLTLAIMDIDHFKQINDTYGHPIGDKVLKVVAGRIQQQVRESDFFGRIGGEEFAFLLVDSDLENAMNKVEELRQSIEECNFRMKKKKFKVTISIGVAQFKSRDTIESVYQRADKALVKAKQSGRNRCLSERDLEKES